jgi:hypothetical protein
MCEIATQKVLYLSLPKVVSMTHAHTHLDLTYATLVFICQ